MQPVVSLAEARQHLRVDDDAESAYIVGRVDAAQLMAQHFTNRNIYPADAEIPDDDDTGIVADAAIKAAILLLVGHLYANRETTTVGDTAAALPFGAYTLLAPYRLGMGL